MREDIFARMTIDTRDLVQQMQAHATPPKKAVQIRLHFLALVTIQG